MNYDKRFALSFGFCYNDNVHQDDEKEEYIQVAIEERKRQVKAFMGKDGSCFGVLRVSGVKRVSECARGNSAWVNWDGTAYTIRSWIRERFFMLIRRMQI